MSDVDELLVLRLALLGTLLGFVLLAAILMRVEGRPREVRRPARDGVARLVLVAPATSGLALGEVFVVAGEMTLGRDPRNSIVVPDPSVSGVHATIARDASGWRVQDHGSTNGTFVRGRRVDGRGRALLNGDEVAVGAVAFRFES